MGSSTKSIPETSDNFSVDFCRYYIIIILIYTGFAPVFGYLVLRYSMIHINAFSLMPGRKHAGITDIK